MFVLCSYVFISWFSLVRVCLDWVPFMGCPAFPFIVQGKAWVTAEEKEKNKREREKREKKAPRIVGSFFSFMRVPPIL